MSLNTDIDDGDGITTELIDTIADDTAIDLDAWLDNGENLTATDSQYLWRYRKKQQKP